VAQTDLVVTTQAIATGVEETLALTTDYTVSGVGSATGGTVTLVAGVLPATKKITIRRVRPVTQTTDIRNQGDFYPEGHENAFDHQVMLAQQLTEQVGRCLKIPPTEVGSVALTELPSAVDRANKYAYFDASGNIAAGVAGPFTSTEIAIVASTDTAQAHGLGSVPSFYSASLRCKTAELGYAENDEVPLSWQHPPSISVGGASVYVNSTNIGVITSTSLYVLNKSAVVGNPTLIAPAKWCIVLRAWK